MKLTTWCGDYEGTIKQAKLSNGIITVELTNIGCSITALHVPDKNGVAANIVAGFADLHQYKENPDYFGCVVGRFTNRITNGQFQLNGTQYQLSVNDGNNHLHGGWMGFNKKLWEVQELIETENECGIVFATSSAHEEEGYPGNVSLTVTYLLDRNNQLQILYQAKTDKSTPISLTNHSYFNLSGFTNPVIYDHVLSVSAWEYTAKSASNTATGEILPVAGTALDFRLPKRIGNDIGELTVDNGYDHNFILKRANSKYIIKAATMSEPASGRVITVYTDKPAMQLYTGNFWNGKITGRQNIPYEKHGGVALETQAFPDSPNHPHFPEAILHPGEVYLSTTIYEFGILG
ncbi:galactose mutarotase [Niastella yeongjuensis]|uniref:Aldose 1-epimerase n=1 Tax=Niastella yeongjuensis TaxID=354355 RepID=A0A1V9EEB0_9BACT|nr:aldose epimerase family protein [Niastella yeongjuensis]OQP44468.1 galactose mutarotase [Niastella yeongjuensis]SEO86594.1 aldose 1-epimerase [Niastella yeongjuensis]